MYLLVALVIATLLITVAVVVTMPRQPKPNPLHYEDLAPGADYYLDVANDTVVVRAGSQFGSATYKQVVDDVYAHTDLPSLKSAVCVRTLSGCVYNSRLVRASMPLSLPARTDPPQEGKVPHTIFMSADSHACSPEQRRRLLTYLPPDYDFTFYDHAARRALVAEFFEPRILEAYDACLAESYRRNIWALCALYVYGGVFVGAVGVPLPASIQEHDLYFSGFDRFVSSVAGNPLLYEVVQLFCENVERREYGASASRVCGSALMYDHLERSGYGDWVASAARDAPEPRWAAQSAYVDDYKPVCRI